MPVATMEPVSYTHLDVYKRQALAWANTGKPTQPAPKYTNKVTPAHLGGKIQAVIITAKVCNVKGTPMGMGMDTLSLIHIFSQHHSLHK